MTKKKSNADSGPPAAGKKKRLGKRQQDERKRAAEMHAATKAEKKEIAALLRQAAEDDDGDVLRYSGWSMPLDLTAALRGDPPPGPEICDWHVEGEHRALFYRNQLHSVFGEPESLKTWMTLFGVAQQLKAGHHVIFIDLEDNEQTIVDRLRRLGVSTEMIDRYFHYFRPDDQALGADDKRIEAMVRFWKPTLVVIDGVTEAYAMNALSINAPEDSARWLRFARTFQVTPTADYQGPAIVELDHVVKMRDGRNGWAIGSQHKKAGIKGAAYSVEVVRPFGKGRHGISRIFLEKDSPGGVEWVRKEHRRLVAEFHCVDLGDKVDAWLEEPDVSAVDAESKDKEIPLAQKPEFRRQMQLCWQYVKTNPRVSGKIIRLNVKGVGDKAKQDAIRQLALEGFLVNDGGTDDRPKWVAVGNFSALRVGKQGVGEGDE